MKPLSRIRNAIGGIFIEGSSRELQGVSKIIFAVLACITSIYQIWSVIWGKLDPINQMSIHLSLILILSFFAYTFSKKINSNKKLIALDIIGGILALWTGIYYTVNAERIATRIPSIDSLTNWDVFFGFVLVVLSLEITRRTIGFPIVVVVFIFLAYAIWGHLLNGVWAHREMSLTEVLDQLAFSFNGLWGSSLAVAASFVFMFILFGAFLQKSGAGEFFFEISTAIAGRSRGGAAKIAIFASAFFGTISGSPTANVVTTGAFTIPMAKKTGYKPTFAAAVESVASTGGSILPPIMGSSAFLMAAVTGLSYGSIVIAALLPAVLYYVSLFFMVHFEAVRSNLPRIDKDQLPKVSKTLKNGWQYFIPLIVLVVFLLQGYSPSRTGFYGILAVIAVSWFKKDTRMGLKKIYEAMVDGAKSSLAVSAACAAAGLVIAGIMSTGLGGKLTSIILGITEGMLFPTLLIVMLICIILGMGMPVAAAYILTAMLAAPALIAMGISPMAAHLFIVYFSIISAITPPVAVAAFAAAGIANANPNRVGFEAVRLGLAGFIIPFIFVLEPALLMEGSIIAIIYSTLTALVGLVSLSAGIIGWFINRTTFLERILLIGFGLGMIYPGVVSDIIGIGGTILIYLLQKRRPVEIVENSTVIQGSELQQ
ncbi:TRAP transporter permease [Niallia sp. Krafla_26]|uniref:TRAP transporter permease n=1 Tax=Niallia sp. Krafla_26 TaxID=3064703 RepID=UPI003D16EFCC